MSSTIIRTYTELIRLPTFEERYEYLRLAGIVGQSTFGFDRYLNQALYRSAQWKKLRNEIIVRDNGCDLAMDDHEIYDKIIVHHMNPLTEEDVENRESSIFDPEFLVCVSPTTHNAIHYGDQSLLPKGPIERRPFDTCPWVTA